MFEVCARVSVLCVPKPQLGAVFWIHLVFLADISRHLICVVLKITSQHINRVGTNSHFQSKCNLLCASYIQKNNTYIYTYIVCKYM